MTQTIKKKQPAYDKKEVRIDGDLKAKLVMECARVDVYEYEPVEVGVTWVLDAMKRLPTGAGEGSVRALARNAGASYEQVPEKFQPLVHGLLDFLVTTPRRSKTERQVYERYASLIYHVAGLEAPEDL